MLQQVGHSSNGRCQEQITEWDVSSRTLPQLENHLRSQQRMSAQGKEIILDTDPADTKDFCPDIGHVTLQCCTRCHIGFFLHLQQPVRRR